MIGGKVNTMTREQELSTKEAAALAGVTDSYIRYLLIDGKIEGRKLNNWVWLVDQRSLEKWIDQRKEGE